MTSGEQFVGAGDRRDRSRRDHRKGRVERTVDGPSNKPARSPYTSRRSACPGCRPSSRSSVDSPRRRRGRAVGRRRGQRGGRRGRIPLRERGIKSGVLGRGKGAGQDGLGERAEQLAAALPHQQLPLRVVGAGRAGTFIERVQPVRQALPEGDREATHRAGDWGPLALGVAGDVGAAAEGERPAHHASWPALTCRHRSRRRAARSGWS